jgi:hypothetical protein
MNSTTPHVKSVSEPSDSVMAPLSWLSLKSKSLRQRLQTVGASHNAVGIDSHTHGSRQARQRAERLRECATQPVATQPQHPAGTIAASECSVAHQRLRGGEGPTHCRPVNEPSHSGTVPLSWLSCKHRTLHPRSHIVTAMCSISIIRSGHLTARPSARRTTSEWCHSAGWHPSPRIVCHEHTVTATSTSSVPRRQKLHQGKRIAAHVRSVSEPSDSGIVPTRWLSFNTTLTLRVRHRPTHRADTHINHDGTRTAALHAAYMTPSEHCSPNQPPFVQGSPTPQ